MDSGFINVQRSKKPESPYADYICLNPVYSTDIWQHCWSSKLFLWYSSTLGNFFCFFPLTY